jgi:protein dithiol oxidoreductase (disulfide-forming)
MSMKRREFAKTTVAAILLMAPGIQSAMAERKNSDGDEKNNLKKKGDGVPIFIVGKQYQVLKTPAPISAPADKVEILEFFWYACPHCFEFEPLLEKWLKTAPKYYSFQRVPINFGAGFDKLQKLYYTLLDMGVIGTMQLKIMDAVQVKRIDMSTDEKIFTWIQSQKIDVAKFKSIYNSFGVSTRIARATQLQNAYGLTGVPALGVAGQYIADPTMTNGLEKLLQVTDYLAKKVRSSASAAK